MNLAVLTAQDPFNFDEDEDLGSELEKKWIRIQRWNLKNLSRGLNPPKPGLNLETFDAILSGTNDI